MKTIEEIEALSDNNLTFLIQHSVRCDFLHRSHWDAPKVKVKDDAEREVLLQQEITKRNKQIEIYPLQKRVFTADVCEAYAYLHERNRRLVLGIFVIPTKETCELSKSVV